MQHDVVHAPVVGDDGEAALGDDEQDRDVGAGGADQAAQVARGGEVLAAVDEQQVGVGGLEQRAALGGQDLAPWCDSRARPGSTSADGWSALVSSSSVLMAGALLVPGMSKDIPHERRSRASPRT